MPIDGSRKYEALRPPVLADDTANREVVDSLYVQASSENVNTTVSALPQFIGTVWRG
jgi:hypothetical protein